MLRITVKNEADSTTVNLEGKLTTNWVPPVMETCTTAAAAGNEVVVNLSEVCAVDRHGRMLLLELHQRGVKLVGSGLVVCGIIEEITQ
jgi:anti-anti-sigma regulatory factor